MLVSQIDCFECLFTCLGKKSLLTEELLLYNIRCKYVKKKEKHKYSVFKNTKKD